MCNHWETVPQLALTAVAITLALGVLVLILTVAGVLNRDSAGGRLVTWQRAVAAFAVVTAVSGLLIFAMYEFPQPPKTVRALYARTVLSNDRDAAWGLLCGVDRERVGCEVFDQAVTAALAELGGRVEAAGPTQASYQWTGANGKRVYRLPETSGEDRPCIRVGASPLGEGP